MNGLRCQECRVRAKTSVGTGIFQVISNNSLLVLHDDDEKGAVSNTQGVTGRGTTYDAVAGPCAREGWSEARTGFWCSACDTAQRSRRAGVRGWAARLMLGWLMGSLAHQGRVVSSSPVAESSVSRASLCPSPAVRLTRPLSC